ncbi:hypothetical protein HY251_19000, partial [bacterium]|nr:hypothetical protein [bacterium]
MRPPFETSAYADISSIATYTSASPFTFFETPPPPGLEPPLPFGFVPSAFWTQPPPGAPSVPNIFAAPKGPIFSVGVTLTDGSSSASVTVSAEMLVSSTPTGPFGASATAPAVGGTFVKTATFYVKPIAPSPLIGAATIKVTAPVAATAFEGTIADIDKPPMFTPASPKPGEAVSFITSTVPPGWQALVKWTVTRVDGADFGLSGPCPGSGAALDGSHL